ncbi:hypothetical protein [Paeniglutamicibacter sp.]|uniref:hypothetical protein n=1 Tax=Paeniglutamicibacter sp. TaxID=1934391 RepID=UPI003989E823
MPPFEENPEFAPKTWGADKLRIDTDQFKLFLQPVEGDARDQETDPSWLIRTNAKGKPSTADVLQLVASRENRIYDACGTDGFAKNADTAFFVPTTDPKLGAQLELSPTNGLQAALTGYGKPLPKGAKITGWWGISEKNADILVARKGLVVGVTYGSISQVGRVLDIAYVDPFTKRRAFVYLPLGNEIRDAMQGYVPGMNQSGRYYWL